MSTQTTGAGWADVLNSIATGALGYLDKRMDVERDVQIARYQAAQIISAQQPINTVPAYAQAGYGLNGIMPLLILGVCAVLFLKD